MESSRLNKSRFIVGIILVVIAALILLFAQGEYSTVGAIGIGVLGLVSIAISRRKSWAFADGLCSEPFRREGWMPC